MRLAYVSDQLLPRNATDTAQTLSMVSAFGQAGVDVELVLPVRWGGRAVTAEQLAEHYQVAPTFRVRAIHSGYPGIRGFEKMSHAVRAALLRELREFDLVYTRNLPVVCAALAATRQPVFYETYRPWPRQSVSKRWLFSALRSRPRLAGLVLHSRLAARSYSDLGYEDGRLLVAHNGFDLGSAGEPLSREMARQICDLPRDRFTVTYSGRVSVKKGLLLLLAMARALPRAQFVIVGSEGRGRVEREAEALDNVRVVPWCRSREMLPYLYAADALVIPPTAGPLERVGNTVLPIKTYLYLASGRPIVAAATADLREVLEDGRNAVLVPPDDLDAAVFAVRSLMESSELCARIAAEARADAQRHTWEQRAERISGFIEARLAAVGDGRSR
jgi:glycosyltransferase involved in cell wall biosynthesis